MGSEYSVNLDYLENLDKIPRFKDRVNELKQLQKISVKYHIEDYDIIPEITDEFVEEYTKLIADIIDYLKEEFPDQTKHTEPLIYDHMTQKYMTNFEKSLDIDRFTHRDHDVDVVNKWSRYNFCCCPRIYNAKSTKNISREYSRHIYNAYIKYKSMWQRDQIFKENIDNERKIREKEMIECRDKLIESMTMHYFPDRVEDGIRKPPEWLPGFNLTLVDQVKKQLPNFLIVEWATKQPAYKKKQEELINAHKEKEIRDKIKIQELINAHREKEFREQNEELDGLLKIEIEKN
jgi:hypothetical protein